METFMNSKYFTREYVESNINERIYDSTKFT